MAILDQKLLFYGHFDILWVVLYSVALRANGTAHRAVLQTVLASIRRFAPLRGQEWLFRSNNRYFTGILVVLFYGHFGRDIIPHGYLQHPRHTG